MFIVAARSEDEADIRLALDELELSPRELAVQDRAQVEYLAAIIETVERQG